MNLTTGLRGELIAGRRRFRGGKWFLLAIFSAFIWQVLPAQVEAQGVDNAPPCTEGGLPAEANVPCAAIVQFVPGTSAADKAEIVRGHGANMHANFHVVDAAAVRIASDAVHASLRSDPRVVSVIPDRIVQAVKKPDNPGHGNSGGSGSSGQQIPDGVARIGAAPGVLPYTGTGVGVAIADTGIDLANADLNVAPECFTAYETQGCNDGDGHGTHVSGIVAANNNDLDTVGVAPDATVYAVKVLSNTGSGYDSDIILGLEWIYDNANLVDPPIRVVNMSLGRTGTLNDNPPLRAAIQDLASLHIPVIVAAGNDESLEVSDNVPATYPEVLAIASTTAVDGSNQCRYVSTGHLADTASVFTTDGAFDNATGIGVTISAPGAQKENIKKNCFISSVGILSLQAGGGTTRMSGTSMATPHVTGVVALLAEQSGTAIDPEEARDDIMTYADRIGVAPLDNLASSYSFDGEREGVLSACGALGVACP